MASLLAQFPWPACVAVLIMCPPLPPPPLLQACFPALPQLTSLSLCASGLANLWTTCAALAPLTALRQLALQR